jgi:uncharacterized protein (TIGR02996 family)
MSDDPFPRTISERPNDHVTRAVYADWLEEQGGPGADQAAYLRAEAELAALPEGDERCAGVEGRLHDLAGRLDGGWLAVVSRRPIENCEHIGPRFELGCPKRWEELGPTEKGPRVRLCGACQKNVYYCDTLDEAWRHGFEGRCVALSAGVKRREGDLSPLVLHLAQLFLQIFDDSPPPQEPPARPRRSWWRRLFGWGG